MIRVSAELAAIRQREIYAQHQVDDYEAHDYGDDQDDEDDYPRT